MRTTLLIAVSVLAAAAPAAAQDRGSRQTRDYVAAAGHSDAFEMLEAETALTQSQDPAVRAYAQEMVSDHARTSQGLMQATAQEGLKPPPMGVGSDQAPLLAALQGLRGPDFDKAYWKHQVLGHRSALVTAQGYAENGDDPAVRQAAAAAVPIISSHLAMAEQHVSPDGS